MLLRTLFLALSIMLVSLQANAQPPCQAYRLVTEEVTVPGTIQTESRVCITMPDGRRISVPVINGWLPEVKEVNCQDGSVVRKLDYSAKIAYTGKNTNYVDSRTKQTQKAPYVTKQTTPTKKTLPLPSRTDEVPPARMKKVEEEEEVPKTRTLPAPSRVETLPPVKMPVVPVKKEVTPLQRKLSDIKEEPKITVVPRYDEEKE